MEISRKERQQLLKTIYDYLPQIIESPVNNRPLIDALNVFVTLLNSPDTIIVDKQHLRNVIKFNMSRKKDDATIVFIKPKINWDFHINIRDCIVEDEKTILNNVFDRLWIDLKEDTLK